MSAFFGDPGFDSRLFHLCGHKNISPIRNGLDNELQFLAVCSLLPTCGSQQLPPVLCIIHVNMHGDVSFDEEEKVE